jgi:hypothetical protein
MGCFEPGTETSGSTEGEEFFRQQFLISHSYRQIRKRKNINIFLSDFLV